MEALIHLPLAENEGQAGRRRVYTLDRGFMHSGAKRIILHVCTRETIRPLRDRVLVTQGFDVDSATTYKEGLSMFWARQYDLVLIDVEGANGVSEAEHLCSAIKTAQPEQLVAFVCNWRVANLTDCPDEIVRTEFDPAAFADGVSAIVPRWPN